MMVMEREPGDVRRLRGLIRNECEAKQRDRCRMVLFALDGWEKRDIATALGVAKSTVEWWVYRYRDGGVEALRPRPIAGAKPKLSAEGHEQFKARFTNGPQTKDGVCTLRGKDAVRILNDEFGVKYSLPGVYNLLHRLNLSCLKPRPRHEQNDPAKMEAFRRSAPLLSKK